MSLIQSVAQEDWQEFDDSWSEIMLSEGPIDDVLAALRVVAEKKRMPRCIPQVRQHAEILGKAGRDSDAARLLGQAVASGSGAGELSGVLFEHAEKAWGKKPYWSKYSEIAGMRADSPDARRAWVSFERLLGFDTGKLVFHPGGWGAGEITDLAMDTLEMAVKFQSGKKDRFPLQAAVEIFEPLPEEDLRAIHFRGPDNLKKLMKEDPLKVLRAILSRHNGRVSTVGIKNALMQVGIEGGSWSAWWRKTRKLAENSEWFKVTGTPSKGDVMLLRAATDPVDDLRKQLANFTTLSELLARIKNQLVSKPEEPLREMMLEVLEQKTGGASDPGPVRLAAWMLLREERDVTPEPLLTVLRNASAETPPADPNKPPVMWALFQSLTGTREQERCVGLLQEVLGEAWVEDALTNLHHAPGGMTRPLVDALLAAGKKAELGTIYNELLSRPLRAPEVLIALARHGEAHKLVGKLPSDLARAQALLSLATNLHVNRRGDANSARAQTKLTELLTKGKDPLVRRLLANVDGDAMLSVQRMIQRGVDEELDAVVTDIVMRMAPTAGRPGLQFWENDRIFTTKFGLEKRSQEFKELREVKIPANQDAIGRAAAMGDLSENAEWEAAIEEQRTLTGRAMEMQTELSKVELIENAILPEDMACPGTVVRYKDAGKSREQEIVILGPWDTDLAENVVSYRAPLAAGLLGKRPGEKAKITLPSGTLDVEVIATKPFTLDH
ncbi:MAG: GreA/GreB family elongation factor [Planctomycetota bacterium]|nr:GreA/GreB family elongation factor [Planctomycetota bacterium]